MATTFEKSVQNVNEAYEYETNKWKDLRESSEENFEYVRGNQWVRYEAEAEKLRKKGVPVLNLNKILPIITVIIGQQIRYRYDLKAYPTKQTPNFLAQLLTRMMKYTHSRDYADLVSEMTSAVMDALIANIGGYLCIEWTNEYDALGEFIVRRESPFYHLRDSENESYDINRGRYHLRTKWLTTDDLKSTYPSRIDEIESFTKFKTKRNWMDHVSSIFEKVTKSRKPTKWDYINEKEGLYRVVELWEMQRSNQRLLINLRTDKKMALNDRSENIAKSLIKDRRDFEIVTKKRKELVVTTTLGGVELLVDEKPYDVQIGRFPFVNIFTHWIDGEPLSNVENLKDYQDEHNKRRGNILQILNSTANTGWWVKRLGDGKLATEIEELSVAGINYLGTYRGANPPQKIEPNKFPVGHQYMDDAAEKGMRDTSMVGENMYGQQESSGESGRLFQKRVDQNSIAMEMFFDNIRTSYKMIGNYEVAAFPKKYNKNRIFDLTIDDGNYEEFQINSGVIDDITKGQYSVRLEEVDYSPTAKTQRFMEMNALAASMPQEFVHYPTIIRNAPFEGKDKMADYAEQMMQQQQQMMADSEEKSEAATEADQALKLIGEMGKIQKNLKDEQKVNNKD